MKIHHHFITLTRLNLSAGLMLASTVFAGQPVTETFAVRCYDAGKAALKNQAGIVRVNSGWQENVEVNQVTYDPERTSRHEVEIVLKEAGTYLKTLSAPSSENNMMK